MAVTITSSLRIGLVSGTGVSFSAPVVPALTTDDIYNANNPSETLTSMFDGMVNGPMSVGVIPKAITATELGNSLITDNGESISFDGPIEGGVQITGVNFADLPTGAAGMIAYVKDSSTNGWGETITGGGDNNVMGFFNGILWTVMAK